MVWMIDYRITFLSGLGMALCSLALAQLIRRPGALKPPRKTAVSASAQGARS